MSSVTRPELTRARPPDPGSQLLFVARDVRGTMTTVGKSDLLEAFVQLLVLTMLREGGPKRMRALTKQVLDRTSAIRFVSKASVSMAITKLEISGWIRKEISASPKDEGPYALTDTARRVLPFEVGDWIAFGAHRSDIQRILRVALRSIKADGLASSLLAGPHRRRQPRAPNNSVLPTTSSS